MEEEDDKIIDINVDTYSEQIFDMINYELKKEYEIYFLKNHNIKDFLDLIR